MTTDTTKQGPSNTLDQGKWWAESKTLWGTIITAAATVIPMIGPLIGITLPADVIKSFGDQAINAVQAVVGLVGTILAIYGRMTATTQLTRRTLNLHF